MQIPARLRSFLQRVGYQDYYVEPLTGDASTRQYFRIHTPQHSLIAALYEESFDEHEQPFCSMTAVYAKAGLPVPVIVAVDGELGVVLQNDLGNTRLQDWLTGRTQQEVMKAYCEAIDLCIAIQKATEIAEGSIAARLAFDYEKLHWELDFFHKHYFGSFLKRPLPEEIQNKLYKEFEEIAQELSSRPRVLCHRDYHSRNLMVYRGRQYIIDYQDSRMGPRTYDLASLLRDPYVELSETQISDLYSYYLASSGQSEELAEEFELMTVQRIVKAIGTYSYQAGVRANNTYLPYIPRAARSVVEAASRLKRFPLLCELLAEQAQL